MPAKTRAEYGSQTPPMEKLSTGYLSRMSFQKNQLLAEYNLDKDTKFCPKCEKTRLLKFFGVRKMRQPKTGVPLKVIFQSYCTDCRSLKKGQEPETAKAKKAKKGGKAKVRAQVKAGKAKVVEATPAVEAAPVILGGDTVQTAPAIEIPVVAVEPQPPISVEIADLPSGLPAEEFVPEILADTAPELAPEPSGEFVEEAPTTPNQDETPAVETLE